MPKSLENTSQRWLRYRQHLRITFCYPTAVLITSDYRLIRDSEQFCGTRQEQSSIAHMNWRARLFTAGGAMVPSIPIESPLNRGPKHDAARSPWIDILLFVLLSATRFKCLSIDSNSCSTSFSTVRSYDVPPRQISYRPDPRPAVR